MPDTRIETCTVDGCDTTVSRTGKSVRVYQSGATPVNWSMSLAEACALRDVLSNVIAGTETRYSDNERTD